MSETKGRDNVHSPDAEKAQERKRLPEPGQQSMLGVAGESVSFASVVGESVMDLPVERHANLLSDPRLSHRANAVQRAHLVSEIQQSYGNAHVQRVMGHIREQTHGRTTVQRDLVGEPERTGRDSVRIQVTLPSSYAELERDVASGLGRIMASANIDRIMGEERFQRQLQNYYGSLEQRLPELRDLTIELEVERAGEAPRASIVRATNAATGSVESVGTTPAHLPEHTAPTGAGAVEQMETPREERPSERRAEERPEGPATPTPTVEQAPTPATEGGRGESSSYRIPLDAFRTTLAPIPYGPVTITPSLRLAGAISARPTSSAMARVARLNLRDRQMEMAQTFSNELGRASYELTSQGLAIELFDASLNLAVRVRGNTVEFRVPAQSISASRGNWTFEGSLAMVLACEVNGNPAAVEAILAAMAAAAAAGAAISTITTYGGAIARFVAGLGQSIGAILEQAGSFATGIVPLIVLPGTEELLEQQRLERMGGGPGGLTA